MLELQTGVLACAECLRTTIMIVLYAGQVDLKGNDIENNCITVLTTRQGYGESTLQEGSHGE